MAVVKGRSLILWEPDYGSESREQPSLSSCFHTYVQPPPHMHYTGIQYCTLLPVHVLAGEKEYVLSLSLMSHTKGRWEADGRRICARVCMTVWMEHCY